MLKTRGGWGGLLYQACGGVFRSFIYLTMPLVCHEQTRIAKYSIEIRLKPLNVLSRHEYGNTYIVTQNG